MSKQNSGGGWLLGIGILALIYFSGLFKGIPGIPSWNAIATWIPHINNITSVDMAALKTYPENPPFGRYIFVGSSSQGNTWIEPAALSAYITGGGMWHVLNYPY